MPLSEQDGARLGDMLEAALMISKYVDGIRYEDYLNNRKLQLAIERLVEIIGEAARFVSEECKTRDTTIPWTGIIAQRHVLAHDYGAIKQERIWLVATRRVPELIPSLRSLLGTPPSG